MCFTCGMEFVRSKPVGYVGARRTMTAALKRASWGYVVLLRLRNLACTRMFLRLLLRRKATERADLNTYVVATI